MIKWPDFIAARTSIQVQARKSKSYLVFFMVLIFL